MRIFLMDLLLAVLTAAVPVVTAYFVKLIRKWAAYAETDSDNIKKQDYLTEIANAIADAVSATSQTYVDALKAAGTFTKEAQKEAAQKALAACLASISPAAQAFIEQMYGDVMAYLTTRIEAEVRNQKSFAPTAVLESTSPDVATVAASTAAATAATIATQQKVLTE